MNFLQSTTENLEDETTGEPCCVERPTYDVGPQRKKADSINIVPERDDLITGFGHATFKNQYLLPGETPQLLFARVAAHLGSNQAHAQRLYDYMSTQWFIPATPLLSNTGTNRGMGISCFLQHVDDSMGSIIENWTEQSWLAARGGGIGVYYGDVRSKSEAVGIIGETSGIVPFLKVNEAITLAISQGSLRRGNAAMYLPVWHPEIEEFLNMRNPTGGDPMRKCLHLHQAVIIDDKFMQAVENDLMYETLSPKTHLPIGSIKAREIWIRILTTRLETGEPYILNIDAVRRATPEHHRHLGLQPIMSNLCLAGDTEIDVKINNIEQVMTLQELNEVFANKKTTDKIEVSSYDISSEIKEYKPITASACTNPLAKVMRITDEDSGQFIECTSDHKVFTLNRGYVKASDLTEEDELCLKN